MITSFGFKENTFDQCIYLKFSGSKFIILVLYVDDILFASSDVELLHETKRFISSKFGMKDLGNAYFVLGIQIYRDRSRGILGLSQKSYIDKLLSRFGRAIVHQETRLWQNAINLVCTNVRKMNLRRMI